MNRKQKENYILDNSLFYSWAEVKNMSDERLEEVYQMTKGLVSCVKEMP